MKTIEIENKSGKVKLNESVTKDSISRMIEEIGKLFGAKASAEGADFGEIMNCAENAVDVLDIEINSPGGSVFDGYVIYQEIKSLQDRGVTVNATITGMAASMASVICMACDKVAIVKHGRMMIHDASSGTHGNAEQLRKTADLLDSISSDIANIYSDRTGNPVDEIRAMMKKETWMNAATCLEKNFADEIIGIAVKSESGENFVIDETALTQLSCDNKSKVMFETRNKLTAKITSLETENAELREEITDLTTKVEEFSNASETVAGLNTQIENITSEFATAKAEWETKEATLVADLEAAQAKSTPEAIQAKVTEELAKCSHRPVEVSIVTESEEPTDILAKYESLQGAEKWAFLAANSLELANAARKISPTN